MTILRLNNDKNLYKMKNKYIIFLLFFCLCSYSQTMTEKYNSYLNRYEYFDSYGNLTGYKSYNSYLGVWEYFKNNEEAYNRKPTQYAKPRTDNNFELLQQVANQKESSYNRNRRRVEEVLSRIQSVNNVGSNLELNMRKEKRFNSEVINVLNRKGYDYSSNSLTENVISWIYTVAAKINEEEGF